jgi:hypothetical protein
VAPSLWADKNDARQLRHRNGAHSGEVINRALFGYYPFFFSRDGATINLVGSLPGASAFLIGGGPSLSGLAINSLESVWAMTLNNGPTTLRSRANCTVDEPGRFSLSIWLDPKVMKFVPMAHFEKPLWDNRRLKVDGEWVQK